MSTKGQARRCKGLTKKGKPCRAAATAGGLCFFHANPDKASELGRIGGQKSRNGGVNALDSPSRLETAMDVRNEVARLIRDLSAGQLNPRSATGFASLLSLQLRAIESSDTERRLAAIEKTLADEGERQEAQDNNDDPRLASNT
jgi:general stress protein YciG